MPKHALLLVVCAACRCGGGDSTADSRADSEAPVPACASQVSTELHADIATLLTVRWQQEPGWDRVWVAYGPEGDDSLASPVRQASEGPMEQILLGLPADSAAWFQVVCATDDNTVASELYLSETGPLPDPRLQPVLELWEPDEVASAGWILGAIEAYDEAYYDGPYWQFVLDREGRVVWYRSIEDGRSSTFPRVSRDGTHVVGERVDRFGLAGGLPAIVERFTLDLREQHDSEVPGLSFAWDEREDGSLVYHDRETEDEGWLSVYTPGGERERIFDCASWIADRCSDTWCCEANAVVWDASRDTALYSMWATHTVLEVDLDGGEVTHQWGQLEGSWDFDPESATFELQHFPTITAEGTLLVSTHVPDQLSQQRVREFEIDEESRTLRQVWSHGEGQDLYAQYQGEAHRLDNGNTLINYGTEGVIHEVTPKGDIVWSLAWSEPWMLGHTTLVDDLYALNEGPVP